MKAIHRLYFLLLILLPASLFAQISTTEILASKGLAVVETESGTVRGYLSNGTYTYKGIPYAFAERFMPPQKAKPWKNTRFMGYYGPTCPLDYEPIAARGNGIGMFALQNDWGYPSEDCQSLNIWTQGINDSGKRPVIVWIHGGGYAYGSSHELPFYDGENLSKKGDVVMVSVNHRLNILGFLDLSAYGEEYAYSPNVGLLDLVASLEWIRENISQFGGDPDNVTLFGQSGGGAKITALLNSPVAKGLFHKAIVQSGSYASSYLDSETAQKVSAELLNELELKAEEVNELQKLSYYDLITAGNKAVAAVRKEARSKGESISGSILGPVHDNYFLPYNLFTPEAMELSKGVSVMIGTTKNEFSAGASSRTGEDMVATKARIKEMYPDQADQYMEAVKKAYPNTLKASDYLAIDFMFRPGALRDANTLVNAGHGSTFMYLFAWQSPVDDGSLKSMHCMELPFVFNNIKLGKELTGGGKEAYKLAETVSGAWINFARTGNPISEGLPSWPKYSSEEGATMIFDTDSEVKYHHDKQLLKIVMPD